MLKRNAQLVILFVLYSLVKQEEDVLDELTNMKRTACLIVSRHYVNEKESQLGRLLQVMSDEQQMEAIWKVYGSLGELCESNISQSETQEFYSSVEEFDISNYYYLLEEADFLSILSDTTLTPNQARIVAFHQDFDARHKQDAADNQHADFDEI